MQEKRSVESKKQHLCDEDIPPRKSAVLPVHKTMIQGGSNV